MKGTRAKTSRLVVSCWQLSSGDHRVDVVDARQSPTVPKQEVVSKGVSGWESRTRRRGAMKKKNRRHMKNSRPDTPLVVSRQEFINVYFQHESNNLQKLSSMAKAAAWAAGFGFQPT